MLLIKNPFSILKVTGHNIIKSEQPDNDLPTNLKLVVE